jgi:general secretion pathway protein J
MARGHPGDRPSGFTLLEMLVALVVLALLMVGLTQGVRAGLALRQAQIHRLDDTAELDAVMRLLRTVLGQLPMMPDGSRLLTTDNGDVFTGAVDRVSFVGNLPSGLGTQRRADVTLSLDGRRLMLSWRPHRHDHPFAALPPPTQTVLLHGVERIELAYWGAPQGDAGSAGWQSVWENPAAPDLIRLRLVFPKSDPRHWPDLITAPRP